MPDTTRNQATFPQPNSQAPGIGFPVVRMVAIIGLATGVVLDLATGPYSGKETGETALLRELWDRLEPGEIVLGDRVYAQYRSTAHDDRLSELLGWLRVVAMLGSFLPPVAHLPLDDPWVDSIASFGQDLLADLAQQRLAPPAPAQT
jgi:hypothetical protein